MTDPTVMQIVSLPLWFLVAVFVIRLVWPAPAYRKPDKIGIHIVMSLICITLLGGLASSMWDATFTLGKLISIPLWLLAAFFAIGTVGAVKDKRKGETDGDLAIQFVLGSVFTCSMLVAAAAVWKYL